MTEEKQLCFEKVKIEKQVMRYFAQGIRTAFTAIIILFAIDEFVIDSVNEQLCLQFEIYYASKGLKITMKHYDSVTDYVSEKATFTQT